MCKDNKFAWLLTKDGGFSYHIRELIQELDLTDNAIAPRIQNADDVTHRLHHASLALEAEELRLYAYMFTEFFQVLEGEKNFVRKDYDKYAALRNAISHRQLNPNDPKAAMAQVKQYYQAPNNFEFTPTHEFDFNSAKNLQLLEAEAKTLKGIAMSYLNTRM